MSKNTSYLNREPRNLEVIEVLESLGKTDESHSGVPSELAYGKSLIPTQPQSSYVLGLHL